MTGTARVVRFNWPKYAGAAALLAVAGIINASETAALPYALLWVAAAPGLVWTVTSLAATWWVYDHRRIYAQLAADLTDIGVWAAVHAGFDESTPALLASIGRPPAAVAQIEVAPSPSLRRARRLAPSRGPADATMLPAGSADCIFLTFAAHEIRDGDRQRILFRDLHRALRPDGRLVITEHPRDLATFAVYGPGALHFQSLATWRSRAAEAGLTLESDTLITPFVHRMVWRR